MTVVTVIDIGNFSNEITYFYQADSGGCFNDQTIQAKVGNPSLDLWFIFLRFRPGWISRLILCQWPYRTRCFRGTKGIFVIHNALVIILESTE